MMKKMTDAHLVAEIVPIFNRFLDLCRCHAHRFPLLSVSNSEVARVATDYKPDFRLGLGMHVLHRIDPHN
jgi:hypothetical protein